MSWLGQPSLYALCKYIWMLKWRIICNFMKLNCMHVAVDFIYSRKYWSKRDRWKNKIKENFFKPESGFSLHSITDWFIRVLCEIFIIIFPMWRCSGGDQAIGHTDLYSAFNRCWPIYWIDRYGWLNESQSTYRFRN